MTTSKSKKWWSKGVKFQCQGSGKCCVSHGEFGFVFLTLKDRQAIAKKLKISTAAFTRKYCDKYHGAFHLKEDPARPECMFLTKKSCEIYEARPVQCRTWPFWPEVMSPKAWKKEVVQFCPGVGKGKIISAEQIEKQLAEQKKSEEDLV
ncbi:MAG: zinc/iron-chelating domain-containing protein [Oligoflexia bacterium]|nr:MAG: zinc/iron-chelating domain-containing protein [Oligoflexia bacterium]